jgi:phage baseplate assembly protein W
MSKQFYGIKYPFSEESDSLSFIDLNETKIDGIKSMLLHIILTPKGQRLRRPNFGTNLIKFIFEPNDYVTWDGIKEEIQKQVALYLPEVVFEDINLQHNLEEANSIYVEIDYSINHNGTMTKNKTLVKL